MNHWRSLPRSMELLVKKTAVAYAKRCATVETVYLSNDRIPLFLSFAVPWYAMEHQSCFSTVVTMSTGLPFLPAHCITPLLD